MLSFVIPAHDEAPRLPATIAALRAAAASLAIAYEIVVVDDASRDGTGDVAARHGARVLRVEHRHIAATRNAGAKAATGDVLVFVDADTRVPPETLAAALAALGDGAVGGGARVGFEGPLRWHQRLAVATGLLAVRLARIAPGCFVFCTRTAFESTGGFDERWYAGEDVAMSRSLARLGRFVLLRERVWSSPRKLDQFSAAEHLALVLRVAVRGRRVLRSREHLALWYERRERD